MSDTETQAMCMGAFDRYRNDQRENITFNRNKRPLRSWEREKKKMDNFFITWKNVEKEKKIFFCVFFLLLFFFIVKILFYNCLYVIYCNSHAIVGFSVIRRNIRDNVVLYSSIRK